MPRPGSRLIPTSFGDHLAALVLQTMTAAGTITRPGTDAPVFDPTTGQTTYPNPTTVYDGPMRVQDQLLRRTWQVEFGGEQVTVGRVRISVPLGTGVRIKDRVSLYQATDAALVGVKLRVMQLELSSIAIQQELTCEADLA